MNSIPTRRLSLAALVAFLLASGSGGCTYPIVMHAVRGVTVDPGTPRTTVIKELGPPRRSQHFAPAAAGTRFADAPPALRRAQVAFYDEYRINGLVTTSVLDNPFAGFPEGYTLGMYLTLGLAEVVYFPVTMVQLIGYGSQHSELRLWYDRNARLIAADREKEGTNERVPVPETAPLPSMKVLRQNAQVRPDPQ